MTTTNGHTSKSWNTKNQSQRKQKMTQKTGIELLRAPFPEHQISKLPKETKAQAEERKQNRNTAMNCQLCGGWHHKNAIHLDYVGHAALTDRLLDSDPNWSWEPMAFKDGLPAFDSTGGLWIRLTVCGVSRIGYGHASVKLGDPGAREKEVIGDALRNAAMRFGAALDLWHKGDLHLPESEPEAQENDAFKAACDAAAASVAKAKTTSELVELYNKTAVAIRDAISASFSAKRQEIEGKTK